MIYVTRKIEFSASHTYHNPALSPEENRRLFGKLADPLGHGHNYVLEVTVAGEPDERTGMVLDLKELKEILQRQVMEVFDHKFINQQVPQMQGQVPTTENIARAIWALLEGRVKRGTLHHLRLYETPDLFVDYYGGGAAR